MMKKEETITENPVRKNSYPGAKNCRHFEVVEVRNDAPEFDARECEAKFRRALRNVPSKTFIQSTHGKVILFVRPENLLEFGASVNRQGLEKCETTRQILRHLDKHRAEFLKFEHAARN